MMAATSLLVTSAAATILTAISSMNLKEKDLGGLAAAAPPIGLARLDVDGNGGARGDGRCGHG